MPTRNTGSQTDPAKNMRRRTTIEKSEAPVMQL